MVCATSSGWPSKVTAGTGDGAAVICGSAMAGRAGGTGAARTTPSGGGIAPRVVTLLIRTVSAGSPAVVSARAEAGDDMVGPVMAAADEAVKVS